MRAYVQFCINLNASKNYQSLHISTSWVET